MFAPKLHNYIVLYACTFVSKHTRSCPIIAPLVKTKKKISPPPPPPQKKIALFFKKTWFLIIAPPPSWNPGNFFHKGRAIIRQLREVIIVKVLLKQRHSINNCNYKKWFWTIYVLVYFITPPPNSFKIFQTGLGGLSSSGVF